MKRVTPFDHSCQHRPQIDKTQFDKVLRHDPPTFFSDISNAKLLIDVTHTLFSDAIPDSIKFVQDMQAFRPVPHTCTYIRDILLRWRKKIIFVIFLLE